MNKKAQEGSILAPEIPDWVFILATLAVILGGVWMIFNFVGKVW